MKLRGYSGEELVFRFGQFAWNVYDRLRLAIGYQNKYHRGAGLAEKGHFFTKLQDVTRIARLYEQQSEARRLLIQRADAVCEHRFNLLSYEHLSFDRSGQIDWHFDPIHGITLSRYWWQRMLDPASINGADPKIVWELNRHQHLVTLAQAFSVTGQEQYRLEVISQLRNWMDANPPKYGIHWASSLELAYRAIAWLWAWHLCGSGDVFGALTERFSAMLAMHAEHIEHNLSVYFSPNTHLSGEALGLYYIGTLMPQLKGSHYWRRIGRRRLMECLETHVLSDGGYMERTLWYHRYTLEIYLHFYMLALQNGDPVAEVLLQPLHKLGDFLAYSLQPDLKLPHLGDDDGGRLLPLDGLPGDNPRGVFSVLAVIFRSAEFAFLGEDFSEEALWLLGPTAPTLFQQIIPRQPIEKSKVFAETGYAFLRSGWREDDVYISFDCGRHGWLNCGHAHADMLSLQVYAGAKAIIKDPGTCSYLNPWRDWFRSAEGHAVLRVDGKHPAITAGPFHWSSVPNFGVFRQSFEDQIDYVTGSMDAGSWQHSREIFFLKPDFIMLLDTIEIDGCHEIELRYPLADTEWQTTRNGCVSTKSERSCSIQCEVDHPCNTQLAEGWQSTCYGQREASFILVLKVVLETACTIATLIDLSGVEHCIRRLRQNGKETFVVETFHDGRAVVSVVSSLKEDRICAEFAE